MNEVQKGIRWVEESLDPISYREQISFAEMSGYEHSMALNARSAFDRALDVLLTRGANGLPDRQAHVLDKGRLPEFHPDHRIEISFRFLPAGHPDAAESLPDRQEVDEPAPFDVVREDAPAPPAPSGIRYTKSSLHALNRDALVAIMEGLELPVDAAATKAELSAAILAKAG